MRIISSILFLAAFSMTCRAQQKSASSWWRTELHRPDGQSIVFNFEWTKENGKPVWYIRNASERIRVTDIQVNGDSMIVQMPLYESQFRLKKEKDGNNLSGNWIKGGAVKTTVLPFTARRGTQRFAAAGKPAFTVTGRWSAVFVNKQGPADPAVAEFTQKASHLTGTFLNPTGDYRYLEGTVSNDTLQLSGFDGVHAFLFTAIIDNKQRIRDGWFYSGAVFKQPWNAYRNDTATVPPG